MQAEMDRPDQVAHEAVSTELADEQPGKKRGAWVRYFLIEETSPLYRPLVEVQRRAGWISLAIIFQALDGIDRAWYIPHIPFMKPWQAFIPFFLYIASFVAMWMAFRPTKAHQETSDAARKRPRRWQYIVLVLTLCTTIPGAVQLYRSIDMSFFQPPQFTNDGTSLDTNAALLLLDGRNPYTDSNILSLVRLFPIEPYWTTPLREGQLANTLQYPSTWELKTILDTDLKSGSAPEFESKVSYPSLSFLTLLPFVMLNLYNVLPFYLLCYVLIVVIGWKVARPEMRPWVLLFSLANTSMLTSVVGGNVDMLYILLILLAWLMIEQRWWSPIFLGLAVASKQPAWLFIPFYAILTWRQYGLREAIRRLSIAGIIFLAFNLPFIFWNPQAWLAGMLAPVLDPMFPLGVGFIGLSTTPILPYLPTAVYSLLEIVTLGLCLAWYWRICKRYPEAVMLLAFLPLFFAWRSLPSYFCLSALPLFILQMARMLPNKGKRQQRTEPTPAVRELSEEAYRESKLPVGISARLFSKRATARVAQ